ncbi:MAG: hypothetical protein WCI39_13060 [Gallionellaceae bacterium]
MGSITMTQHANIRKQQRGISESVLDCLLEFGRVTHDNRGGEVLYFDKRAKQRCLTTMGKDVYRRLDGHFDVYAVRGLDGALVTVGHRCKRLHRA